MKIKTKLALLYTSITVGILMIVFVFVYLLSSKTIDNNYNTLLFDKALITAQMHFEKDELNQTAYQKVLDSYQSLMPEASEKVIVANNKQVASNELESFLHHRQIEKLFSKKRVKFEVNDLAGVGIYYPDNEGNFIIVVTAENTQGKYIKATLKNILLVVLLISSLLIFGLLWWNAQQISRPLQQMVKRMQKITAKDLYLRLPERRGNDELAQVTNYFNQMLERLELSFQSQKSFIANASHELKNPLTAIIGECEVMQLKEFTAEEYKDSVKRLESEIERLNSLVNNLFKLAQADLDISEANTEPLNLNEELQSVLNHFELSKYRGRILFEPEEVPFFIKSNRPLLFTALQNLLDNACKYSDKEVLVRTQKTKTGFQIKIEDKGIGIPLAEKHQLFNPFYRGSNTYGYSGSGIGLSLAYKILSLSTAYVSIESAENKGTTVLITWNTVF